MCDECGCRDGDHEDECDVNNENIAGVVEVNRSVTEANDRVAHQIMHYLKTRGIFSVNIMGSPGAGKTTFIEGLSKHIPAREIFVIQGDLESDIDKKRLDESKIDACQINTHSGCHLNAVMVKDALDNANLYGKKYLLIENVGNLVCPAGQKIGQHMDLVVSSTTEGSDKPRKYPLVFMDAGLVLISKCDLSEYVNFDEEQYVGDIKNINANVKIMKVSMKDSSSFSLAAHFIEHERDHLLAIGHEH